MNDAIQGRVTFRGIRRHARIEQHDDRRTLFFGNVGGMGGFDDVGEDEIDIGRRQDMPDIVARPDFPAIRDLSIEGSEVVKKLAHEGSESPSIFGFSNWR